MHIFDELITDDKAVEWILEKVNRGTQNHIKTVQHGLFKFSVDTQRRNVVGLVEAAAGYDTADNAEDEWRDEVDHEIVMAYNGRAPRGRGRLRMSRALTPMPGTTLTRPRMRGPGRV